MERASIAISASAGIAALAVALWLGVTGTRRAPPAHAADLPDPLPQVEADNGWPAPGASLEMPEIVVPAGFALRRVYLDAGHGAEGNTGNRSALCEDEQDFTRELAREVAAELEQSGHFEVRLSRDTDELVGYRARVQQAEAWEADVFISLHSDVRGQAHRWQPEPGRECLRSRSAPGFSVLWSDEGDAALTASRLELARATARALDAFGLPAYDGREYRGLYEGDAEPGVFVDRHRPGERIFVLHRPSMPSIIIETHNALDDREVLRWREAETRLGFARAVGVALVATLGTHVESNATVP